MGGGSEGGGGKCTGGKQSGPSRGGGVLGCFGRKRLVVV